MLKIGSKVKLLLGGDYLGLIGIVLKIIHSDHGRSLINVKITENKRNIVYNIGDTLRFYEKDLELIRPDLDPTSPYQYCNKCDVLTSNKNNLCCDHTGHQDRLS